jgi:flagellar hook-basal body complex protein FliE
MKEITIQNQMGSPADAAFSPSAKPHSPSVSFGQILKGSMDQVNRLQQAADASIEDLATGKQTDIHQTMIAVEKAGVSFELLMQIRNKIISAYETIMRMSV